MSDHSKTTKAATRKIGSITARLLQRAAEIDPEAWKAPMPTRMQVRRSRSFDQAFKEAQNAA